MFIRHTGGKILFGTVQVEIVFLLMIQYGIKKRGGKLYEKAEIVLIGMFEAVDDPAVKQHNITGMKTVWFGSAKYLKGPL
jgi:hypothetical protein